jgi:UDP-N-acetylmuramate dehydrogenase
MTDSNEARRHEPMARHTSWRVGGTADLFIRPATVAGLAEFLGQLPESTPLTFIGLGSNLLVRDGGIRGAVVCTSALPRTLEQLGDGSVRASAGLPCATLARRCARLGLGPAAFFAGIPGTVGGALAMNAGAFGGESWDSVVEVETIDRHGLVRKRQKSEFEIAYRSVHGPGQEWFLAATFRFEADLSGESERIRSLLKQRSDTQPLGRPSAGSVFRNPPGDHAGRLIESAGLKGRSIGGAEVSTKHANFIINRGNATAADIEQLIELVRDTVRERFAVELVPEVRVVGEMQEAGQ